MQQKRAREVSRPKYSHIGARMCGPRLGLISLNTPILPNVLRSSTSLGAVNLPANLAGREGGRVHVGIGRVGLEGILESVEITCNYVL